LAMKMQSVRVAELSTVRERIRKLTTPPLTILAQ